VFSSSEKFEKLHEIGMSYFLIGKTPRFFEEKLQK
jgi:hypothetical protein